jgi:phosphoenolpyruvate synthase/pyruvate phosphate dikinase
MASQSGKGEALVELIMNEIGYKLPGGDRLNTRIGGCRHKFNLVRGISKLEATIKREWSTFWTDWLGYWLRFPECDALNIDLAINIQQHLAPEYCGYVSSHPEKHPNDIFIGVSWGLWGAWFLHSWLPPHVSISTECDTYRIDRNTRRVLEVKIGNKKNYGACREDGTIVRKRVPYRKQKVPVLEESQIQELLFVHDRMEELYGGPTNISWKYDKGEFFII